MILFLSSIAGSEILVILLFILIFFGSKSIPGMSRSLGRGIRQIKDASQEIQDEIRKTTGDMKKDMDINRTLHEATENFKKPFDNVVSDLNRETNEVQRSLESNSTTLKKETIKESISTVDMPKPEKEDDNVV
jgi:sec-independent protein translocase protein TatA